MPPPEGDAVTADGIVRGGLSNNDCERGCVRGIRGGQWVCIGLIERSAIWARRGQSRTTNRIIMFHGGRWGRRNQRARRSCVSSALDEVAAASVAEAATREAR